MPEKLDARVAFDLGTTARSRAIENGENICLFEKQRIELANEPEVIEWQSNLQMWSVERDHLQAFLSGAVRSVGEDLRQRRRYNLTIATILALAGFGFAHFAFSPFGFGISVWLYAAGLTIVSGVLTALFLEKYESPRAVKLMIAAGLLTSLTGIVILSVVRADIVLLNLKTALSGYVSDNFPTDLELHGVTAFYQSAAEKLRFFFGLLAFSIELATGLMIWEALRIRVQPQEGIIRAHRRLKEIDEALPIAAARVVFLKNEPLAFEAEFRREYHRGLLQATDRGVSVRIGPVIVAALAGFLLASIARAQTLTDVTVIDFSKSDAVVMNGGRTAHQGNVEEAAQHVAELPPGSQFSVLGISEESFARPLILVSGRIPDEPGPLSFLNRIDLARQKASRQVREAAATVKPNAVTTDIFGALLVASQVFGQSPGRRSALFIFSDMRQSAPPVNIERPSVVATGAAMKAAEKAGLIPNLKDVDVFVYSAHAVGKDSLYWQSLRGFWQTYFAKSGARLQVFSMLPPPRLATSGKTK